MILLTILLAITTVWMIYHFSVAYYSRQADKTPYLRKLGYGKTMGIFALMTGIFGQMIGFSCMFSSIEEITATEGFIKPEPVFGAIKATMIVTIYGSLIYLFSLLLWFVASLLIEKKQERQISDAL